MTVYIAYSGQEDVHKNKLYLSQFSPLFASRMASFPAICVGSYRRRRK
ncbi:hypothetical protein CORC01_02199 [Colletotrichum orchidophilum]|uniref:Uncharacterized protein n=1 Tax=Colletotrichum orchidophilum TaxID=1209926 RepID=A0A1G4BM66_9PEZI|nr:uncharacterized protein CORC01_02199 [Colletotrichum orchidophilum]OHF02504.1 hypothetical protein CORC01_02199 [Colletotrichum orchidophilum]